MLNRIKYIRGVQLIKSLDEPGLLIIKVRGLAEMHTPFSPVLIPKDKEVVPSDGILQLDFLFDESGEENFEVSLEVEIVIRLKNLPSWVKGFRINADENSDIELL